MTPETPENPSAHETTVDGSPVPEGRRLAHRPAAFLGVILGLALLVLIVDQFSKVWAQDSLVVGEAARPLLGDFISLRLIYNSGAALSLGSGMTWVLTLLSAAVVVFIVVSARRVRSMAWSFALGLVLGGALGNLGDRLFRAPGFPEGHVVDFIDYGPFIGNVADIAIVVAAVLIAILAFAGYGPDGRRAGAGAADDVSADASASDQPPADEATS